MSRWGVPLGLAAIVFLAFLPALGNGFVDWDDQENFTRNPSYRGLGLDNLRWMFTTFRLGHYQPLAWVTLGFDYTVWGMNPAGYHLTSLALHAASVAVLYFVLRALLRKALGSETPAAVWAAAAAALFWGVHPLRVESVVWITERRDVLCGFFFLLSLYGYLRWVEEKGGSRGLLCLAVGAFAASLLSKALGIMLPWVLLLLDVYPLRRWTAGARRNLLLEKVPFFAVAAADGIVMIFAMGELKAFHAVGEFGPFDRIMQAAYGLCFYPWKTILPTGLAPLYSIEGVDFREARFFIALGAAAAVTAALVAFRRRWPGGLAAWTAFALLVFPVLGLVVTGYQLVADRYSYLSMLPGSALLAAGLCRWGRPALVAGAVILAGLGAATWNQCGVWRDSYTLWNGVIAAGYPSGVAFMGRGEARAARGDREGARADFDESIRRRPEAGSFNFRGSLRAELGDPAGAASDFDAALRMDPKLADAYYNRGILRATSGDLEGALRDFDDTIRLTPDRPEGYVNRGQVLEARGDRAGAARDFREALRRAPAEWPPRAQVEARLRELNGKGP